MDEVEPSRHRQGASGKLAIAGPPGISPSRGGPQPPPMMRGCPTSHEVRTLGDELRKHNERAHYSTGRAACRRQAAPAAVRRSLGLASRAGWVRTTSREVARGSRSPSSVKRLVAIRRGRYERNPPALPRSSSPAGDAGGSARAITTACYPPPRVYGLGASQ